MNRQSLWSAQYITLLIYSICISVLFYALTPLLTQYTTQHLKLSLAMAGILSGLFSIVSIAARPLSGYLSDSGSPSAIFSFSTIGLGLSIMCVTLFQFIPGLIAIRAAQGIFYAFSSTSCFVLLSRYIPPSRLNEGVGYYGMGQVLSSSIGMSLGILLMDTMNITACYLLLGIAVLLAAATQITIHTADTCHNAISSESGTASNPDNCYGQNREKAKKETDRKKAEWNTLIPLIPIGLLGALFSISNGVETTFLALIGQTRGIGHTSLFFTLYIVVLLLSRPVMGYISDTKGIKAVLYPALILMAAESFLIGRAASLLPLLAAALLKALGQGAAHPSLQAESIRKLGYEKSGTASSIFLLFTDLGQGLGPMLAGCLAAYLPFHFIFYGISTLYIAALLLTFYNQATSAHRNES